MVLLLSNHQNVVEEFIKIEKKPPIRRSKKQIIKLLKDYQSSKGLSIIKFCKLHDINKSNFYNWQKHYGYGSKEPGNKKPKGFLRVELTPSAEASLSVPVLFAEVKGIRFYHAVSTEYLKALVS